MHCPYCRSNQTTCIDSREQSYGFKRRRRYKCSSCGGRYSTLETIVSDAVAKEAVPTKLSAFRGESAEEKQLRKQGVIPPERTSE